MSQGQYRANYKNLINTGTLARISHLESASIQGDYIDNTKAKSFTASALISGSNIPYSGYAYKFVMPVTATTTAQKVYDNSVDLRHRYIWIRAVVIPNITAGTYLPNGIYDDGLYAFYHMQKWWLPGPVGYKFYYQGDIKNTIKKAYLYSASGTTAGSATRNRMLFTVKWGAGANTSPLVTLWVSDGSGGLTAGKLYIQRDTSGSNQDLDVLLFVCASNIQPPDSGTIYPFLRDLKSYMTRQESVISYVQQAAWNTDALKQRTIQGWQISDQYSGGPSDLYNGGGFTINCSFSVGRNANILHIPTPGGLIDYRYRAIWVRGSVKIRSKDQYIVGSSKDILIKSGHTRCNGYDPQLAQGQVDFEGGWYSGSGQTSISGFGGGTGNGYKLPLVFKLFEDATEYYLGTVTFWISTSGATCGQLMISRSTAQFTSSDEEDADQNDLDFNFVIDISPSFCLSCSEMPYRELNQLAIVNLDENDCVLNVQSPTSTDSVIYLPEASTVPGNIVLTYFGADNGGNVSVRCASGDTFSVDGETTATRADLHDAHACLMIIQVADNLWRVLQDRNCDFT